MKKGASLAMDNKPKVKKKDEENVTSIWVERVSSVVGSTAGAGSGEFHHYRRQRRRERARLLQMEKEEAEKAKQENYEQWKQGLNDELQQKQAKKAERRKKRAKNRLKEKIRRKAAEEGKKINQFANDGLFMQNLLAEIERKKQAAAQEKANPTSTTNQDASGKNVPNLAGATKVVATATGANQIAAANKLQ